MNRLREKLNVTERRACRVLGQARSTQRRRVKVREDEDALTGRTVQLAACYGRYGYRRITALLRREGWRVNHKRVERIWRQQGLKVPEKQPKRVAFGSMTAPAFGCAPRIKITYGVMTSSTIERATVAPCGC